LRVNANYTFRHSWYISDPEDPSKPGKKGDRVPWEPAHLANLSFYYLQQRGLRLGMSLHAASASDLAMPRNGGIFDETILVHNSPKLFVSGFVAWRVPMNSQ
jgi:hypothetical protein